MDITKYLIQYRRPSQYVYGGENYIEVYKHVDRVFKKTQVIENKSLTKLDNYQFDDLKRELSGGDTGLVLNSASFIFNILEFDKIPFREELRKDLVNWRLQKVFPEDIAHYHHEFFKLDRNKVLSILFKKELSQQLEELFKSNGISLTYFGNSTVELINNVRKLKPAPDFFVEIDRNLSIIVFLSNTNPFYIRKFRSDKEADTAAEIIKTINYVKNSYGFSPTSYSLLVNDTDFDFDTIHTQLQEVNLEVIKAAGPQNQKLLLPA